MGSAKLEERIAEIAESLDAIVPAAIAASTAALRDELSEIKDLLLGDAGQQRQQLQQSTDDVDGGAAGRGGALSSDRTLANRKDGKWVKMAALGDDTVYGDAEEYWHHTGTNAIRMQACMTQRNARRAIPHFTCNIRARYAAAARTCSKQYSMKSSFSCRLHAGSHVQSSSP